MRTVGVRDIADELDELRQSDLPVLGPERIEAVYRVVDGKHTQSAVLVLDNGLYFCLEHARERCNHVEAVAIKRALETSAK